MRNTRFANGEFYHVYNRGTDKRIVFSDKKDFDRFIQSMREFNSTEPIGSLYVNSFESQLRRRTSKLVNIVCYCLNPNHYHMILEQLADGGISEFMKRLGGGYTKYFNNKNHRNGVLFQGKFKAIHINSNRFLLHLSAYINLNNRVHRLKYGLLRSSWEEFMYKNKKEQSFCKKSIVLNQFKNTGEYKDFAESSLKDIIERKNLHEELAKMLIEPT